MQKIAFSLTLFASLWVSPIVKAGGFCTSNADCNDQNPCTQDQCIGAPFGTCIHAPLDNVPCPDDGNQCRNDICDNGVCTHPPKPFGTPCGSSANTDCTNPDTCNGSGTCLLNNESNGTPCTDDANTCTTDVCSNGVCSHPAKPAGSPCGSSVNNDCTNPDTCNASGQCLANHEPNGTACTDDGNSCTSDTCTNGNCTHPLKPAGTTCNDSNNCTENDVCSATGTCAGTPIPDCGGGPCPLEVTLQPRRDSEQLLNDLRDYRDVVMEESPLGRSLIELYYRNSEEVAAILESSGALRRQALSTVLDFMPVVQDILAGADVSLTRADLAEIDGVLAQFQRLAGDQLSGDIQQVRDLLHKGTELDALGIGLESRANDR